MKCGPRYHRCRPRTPREPGANSPNRMYRDPSRGYLFGVAAGVANYFGIDGWIIRALLIVGLFVAFPPVVFGYLLLAVILPRAPEELYKSDDEETFWRGVRVDPAQSFSKLKHRFRELEQRLRSMEAYVTSDAYRVHSEINNLDR